MKKFLLSAMAIAVMASCSKKSIEPDSPVTPENNPSDQMTFVFGVEGVAGYTTNASGDAGAFKKVAFGNGDKIGMWMQHTPTNGSAKASFVPAIASMSYGNVCYTTGGGDEAIFAPSVVDNGSDGQVAFSWLSAGSATGVAGKFNFVAYYPYTGTLQSFSDDGGITTKAAGFDWTAIPANIELDQTSVDGTVFANFWKSDALYSKLESGSSFNMAKTADNKVKLTFKHAFAMAEFQVYKDPTMLNDPLTLKEIQLTGAKVFSAAVISYVPSINAAQAATIAQATVKPTAATPIIIKSSPKGVAAAAGESLVVAGPATTPSVVRMIIPVSNNALGVASDYVTGDYKYTFLVDKNGTPTSYKHDVVGGTGKKIESGKKYIYKATITESGVVVAGTVEDWDDAGNTSNINPML